MAPPARDTDKDDKQPPPAQPPAPLQPFGADAGTILRRGDRCNACGQIYTGPADKVEPLRRVRILGDGKGKNSEEGIQAGAGTKVMILGVLRERDEVVDLPLSEAINACNAKYAEEVDEDTPLGKPEPERQEGRGGLGKLRNANRTLGGDPQSTKK